MGSQNASRWVDTILGGRSIHFTKVGLPLILFFLIFISTTKILKFTLDKKQEFLLVISVLHSASIGSARAWHQQKAGNKTIQLIKCVQLLVLTTDLLI